VIRKVAGAGGRAGSGREDCGEGWRIERREEKIVELVRDFMG